MKIKLPKTMKQKIKMERDKVFKQMGEDGVTNPNWEELNKKYWAYSDMMKPSWKVTPDTLLICLTNIFGILLVLNFEKLDLIRSKAFGCIMKGRV